MQPERTYTATEMRQAREAEYRRGLKAAWAEADEWANSYDNWSLGNPGARHYPHMRDAAQTIRACIGDLVRLHDEAIDEAAATRGNDE